MWAEEQSTLGTKKLLVSFAFMSMDLDFFSAKPIETRTRELRTRKSALCPKGLIFTPGTSRLIWFRGLIFVLITSYL